MTDREMWDGAVAVVRGEYEALTGPVTERLRTALRSVRRQKEEICSIPAGEGASLTCFDCGGRCCDRGKYHFSAIDLLALLDTGSALFQPSFGSASCPYLGQAGCLMEPQFRPFTCVTFHCERLEALLVDAELERLYLLERNLRAGYGEIEGIFGRRLTQGLLLAYARHLEGRGTGILGAGR